MKKLLLGFFAGILLVLCGNSVFAKDEISQKELSEIKQKAEAGDGVALDQLGICYKNGVGVAKDEQKAFELFRKSADKGCVSGLYDCAVCCYEGRGTEKNKAQAVLLLEKAAKGGSIPAASFLGACYLLGDGIEKDASMGFAWTRKAAEEGDARAEYNLGCCYEDGCGTDKDLKLAETWYKKAAKDGFEKAEEALKELQAPVKEPKIYTNAQDLPASYKKIGSTEFSNTSKSISFGKKSADSNEKKKTLREKVLQQAREEKADAVLILKEKGNAENGYISAEFYRK